MKFDVFVGVVLVLMFLMVITALFGFLMIPITGKIIAAIPFGVCFILEVIWVIIGIFLLLNDKFED